MEDRLVAFLDLVYKTTPSNVLNAWGVSRYNRFKTKCWKHLEETADLSQFVNRYFKNYDMSLSNIIEFLDSQQDLSDMFKYLSEHLTILVGRLQFMNRQAKEETQKDDKQNVLRFV